MPTKAQRHAAIYDRAKRAVAALHHNATPIYPALDAAEDKNFALWFADRAKDEIEYLDDGGAYGRDYHKTLVHAANAGLYSSPRARQRFIAWKLRLMREDRARYAAWEWASELFGSLYTYGRGGRTLAPGNLVTNGCYWRLREEYFADRSLARTVEGIRVIESFNRYVAEWCRSVPELWAEYMRESLDENAALSNN